MPFVCYLIIIVFNNMIEHVEWWDNYRIILIIMKHELVEWLYIDLALAWLWVQTLVNTNQTFFLPKFPLAWRWKGMETLDG